MPHLEQVSLVLSVFFVNCLVRTCCVHVQVHVLVHVRLVYVHAQVHARARTHAYMQVQVQMQMQMHMRNMFSQDNFRKTKKRKRTEAYLGDAAGRRLDTDLPGLGRARISHVSCNGSEILVLYSLLRCAKLTSLGQ